MNVLRPEPAGDPLILLPFRGLRRTGDPAAFVSPPYDTIGAERAELLARAQKPNAVRLILPDRDETDPRLRYRRAADALDAWRHDGVLALDRLPALYVYEQYAPAIGRILQRGLIGALQLPSGDDGPVMPHEHVVPAAVADRQALMGATRANPEPILLAYHGAPAGQAEAPASELVELVADTREPLMRAPTPDGVVHRLWAVTDPAEHALVAADLAGRRALIADGHHRYTAYRWLAESESAGPVGRPVAALGLALLVDTARHPLKSRAIHRWLPDVAAGKAIDVAGKWFDVEPLDGGRRAALDRLARADPERPALAVVAGHLAWLLTSPSPVLLDRALPDDLPEPLRGLDVTVLHHVLAGEVWDVPDTAHDIRFDHDSRNAVALAHRAHGLAVLLRAVPESTVAALAARGVLMPRKSTAFGPKPAMGLVIRPLDEEV